MGWLSKAPFVSLLIAIAMLAVPFVLGQDAASDLAEARFESARAEAREFWVRNPRLEIDAAGERVVGAEWFAETTAELEEAENEIEVHLPARLLARSQARLDDLIATAYAARLEADPAWKRGVLDASTPTINYFAHAFVHEAMPGVILCVLVLLFVGAPLERTWGSFIYAAFVAGSVPAVAQAYRLLDASSGVPWSGSAGLCGALLGAYFIRGLGGHFLLPGLILLPAWLGAEAFAVRGFWIDDLGSVPWATLFAAIGLGAGISGALRLANIEAALEGRSAAAKASGPHPVVARAARLRSDGDPYQAFDLLQAAWREEPADTDLAEAFFSIAVDVGQPEAAAEAILPSLRSVLRKGDFETAVEYWFPLAAQECGVELEATAFVRLGEALLDAGHAEQALFSLRRGIDVGVSSAHATRIVNIARDLDADLACEAAGIALADPTLDQRIRSELTGIAQVAQADAPTVTVPAESASQLDRRVHAEHQTVEITAFPTDLDLDADLDLETDLDGELDADLDLVNVSGRRAESNEEALAEQALDMGALSAESLGGDAGGVAASFPEESSGDADVLSHWSGATDEAPEDQFEDLDADDLESPNQSPGLTTLYGDQGDPFEDETDSDLTPMMDVSDELTSPLAKSPDANEVSAPVFDQPTTIATRPIAPLAAPADFAFGITDETSMTMVQVRALKAIDAVPIQATSDWIELDADDRGKSKLPLNRIEAISLAAVGGLGPRPVLILECVLNWNATPGEPLKSIRFRSDRFDPMAFAPGAETPLIALNRWVADLVSMSQATCLPDRDLLDGRFARFDTLADYEREVLMASSEG